MEFLFELLAELLLQIIVEALAEFGLRVVCEPFERRPNPFVAAIGYVVFGGLLGGLSLLLFPNSFINSHAGRIANLIIAPLVAGAVMAHLGAWRRRRLQRLLRLDRFAYGALFALAMGLVRYLAAR